MSNLEELLELTRRLNKSLIKYFVPVLGAGSRSDTQTDAGGQSRDTERFEDHSAANLTALLYRLREAG